MWRGLGGKNTKPMPHPRARPARQFTPVSSVNPQILIHIGPFPFKAMF
jgi:hypothetical protein